MSERIPAFLAMLERGKDSPLIRFALGTEYLWIEDYDAAAEHFANAVQQDENYSAAWKFLGKSHAAAGRIEEASAAFTQGIIVAETKGDKQAVKEMQVFMRRLTKKSGDESGQ